MVEEFIKLSHKINAYKANQTVQEYYASRSTLEINKAIKDTNKEIKKCEDKAELALKKAEDLMVLSNNFKKKALILLKSRIKKKIKRMSTQEKAYRKAWKDKESLANDCYSRYTRYGTNIQTYYKQINTWRRISQARKMQSSISSIKGKMKYTIMSLGGEIEDDVDDVLEDNDEMLGGVERIERTTKELNPHIHREDREEDSNSNSDSETLEDYLDIDISEEELDNNFPDTPKNNKTLSNSEEIMDSGYE